MASYLLTETDGHIVISDVYNDEQINELLKPEAQTPNERRQKITAKNLAEAERKYPRPECQRLRSLPE